MQQQSVQILDRSILNRVSVVGAVQVTLIAAITVVVVGLPEIRRSLGLDAGETIMVSSGYGLSFSGLLLLGGRLADRFGQRHTLLAGLIVFVAGSATGGVAGGGSALIAARFAQGVGAALAAPAAMAFLPLLVAEGRARQRAFATWGVLAVLGAAAGTLVGGVLAGAASWRWCFLAIALAGLAELVAAARLLPVTPADGEISLDIAGALLATTAISLLSYGLIDTADHRWASMPVAAPIGLGLAAFTAFIGVERRVDTPLIPVPQLRSVERVGALLAIWATAAATTAVWLFLALYFQQVQGRSAGATTARLIPLGLVFAVGAVAVRPVVARLGPVLAAPAGLLGGAAGLVLLSNLHGYAGPLVAGLVVFPAAASLAFAASTVLALHRADSHDSGALAGLVNTAMETGPTVGLALLVSLASAVSGSIAHGYSVALRTAAAALVVVAIVITAIACSRKSDSKESS